MASGDYTEVYRAEDGWRWRRCAANHRIIAEGGEAFGRHVPNGEVLREGKYEAERAARRVFPDDPTPVTFIEPDTDTAPRQLDEDGAVVPFPDIDPIPDGAYLIAGIAVGILLGIIIAALFF